MSERWNEKIVKVYYGLPERERKPLSETSNKEKSERICAVSDYFKAIKERKDACCKCKHSREPCRDGRFNLDKELEPCEGFEKDG